MEAPIIMINGSKTNTGHVTLKNDNMKKLSEFKQLEDIPLNEDIEVDIFLPFGAKPTLEDKLNDIASQYRNGRVLSIISGNSFSPIFRIQVPVENIPKPGVSITDISSKEEAVEGRMDFGKALHLLKMGFKVQRIGWNGKGMWLRYISGLPCNDAGSNDMGDIIKYIDEIDNDMELLPWIGMKTADDKFVPWLASQTDILAEDYQEVK